jgi:hypothetical protein
MGKADALVHIQNIINTQIEYTVTPVTFGVVTYRGTTQYPIGGAVDDGLRGFRPLSNELKRIQDIIEVVGTYPSSTVEWVEPNQVIYGRLYPTYADWVAENVPEMFAEIIGEGLEVDLTPYTDQIYDDMTGSGTVGDADQVSTDTTNFDGVLSSADTNVQLALDTIDDHRQFDTCAKIDEVNIVGTASSFVLDTVPYATYPTVKWLITVADGTSGQYASEVLGTTTGTLVGHSEINVVEIGTELSNVQISVDLNGTDMRLLLSTDTANVNVKVTRVVNVA